MRVLYSVEERKERKDKAGWGTDQLRGAVIGGSEEQEKKERAKRKKHKRKQKKEYACLAQQADNIVEGWQKDGHHCLLESCV